MKVFPVVSIIFLPSLCLFAQTARVITIQPISDLAPIGETARFDVSAVGTGPLTYQWQFNGATLTNINNATNLPSIITTVAHPLAYPTATAADHFGNVYISEGNAPLGNVQVLRPDGSLAIVVKGGMYSPSVGDGGPATNASVTEPYGVAVDQWGNLYIADSGNARIRKVGINGIITTIAGTGVESYSGDGGPATNAALNWPANIVVDAAGNVFFTDEYNQRVRKIDLNGTISTVAGGGTNYPGDGGSALDVGFPYPVGVAVDSIGNLFIGARFGNRVHRVGADGVIWTVAGGSNTALGDGGAGTNATLSVPTQLAIDRFDNLFIADTGHGRIRKLTPDGIISTVAGNGNNESDTGDGGPATSAGLDAPFGVSVDDSGNLFAADQEDNNSTARKIAAPGPTL